MAAIQEIANLAARLVRECKDRDSAPRLLELGRHMRAVQQDFLILQQSRDKLTFENTRLKKELASLKLAAAAATSGVKADKA